MARPMTACLPILSFLPREPSGLISMMLASIVGGRRPAGPCVRRASSPRGGEGGPVSIARRGERGGVVRTGGGGTDRGTLDVGVSTFFGKPVVATGWAGVPGSSGFEEGAVAAGKGAPQ